MQTSNSFKNFKNRKYVSIHFKRPTLPCPVHYRKGKLQADIPGQHRRKDPRCNASKWIPTSQRQHHGPWSSAICSWDVRTVTQYMQIRTCDGPYEQNRGQKPYDWLKRCTNSNWKNSIYIHCGSSQWIRYRGKTFKHSKAPAEKPTLWQYMQMAKSWELFHGV